MKTKLRINRPNTYTNKLRSIDVFLDNKKLTSIKNNEEKVLQIEPGTHQLYAKIDWCYSPKKSFQIAEGEEIDFKLSGFKHSNWMMKIALFLLPFDILLSFFLDIYIIALLLIIPFSILFYYLIFGRRKYLNLELK